MNSVFIFLSHDALFVSSSLTSMHSLYVHTPLCIKSFIIITLHCLHTQQFIHIKRELFLATVTKCLLIDGHFKYWGFLSINVASSPYMHYEV